MQPHFRAKAKHTRNGRHLKNPKIRDKCVWPVSLHLSLILGFFISLIDEIQFMLISSRHICIRSISRIFPYHGKYFHTTDNISILWHWTKLWKLDFPTFFYNISKVFPHYGRGSLFPGLHSRSTFSRK